MKYAHFLFILLISSTLFAQNYERQIIEYEKLKKDSFIECDLSMVNKLSIALTAIEENNSKQAVKLSKAIYDTQQDCFQIYEVYGYSLFKSGEWFEGLEIIEKGILKFGSVPELIKRRSEISLEMAQLGTGQKNIDGNSVYKANFLTYDEEQFKNENFKSALSDLQYLMKTYARPEETFLVAKVLQILGEYSQSTEVFSKLIDGTDYKNIAIYNISENYLQLNKYDEAEQEINKLLVELPREGELYEKLAEISEKKLNTDKANEYRKMAVYYSNIPSFSNLEYSAENYDLVAQFGSEDVNSSEKMNKLNGISKNKNKDYVVDVCLIILKLHMNHGNGVEERATEILSKIGKQAIPKVNLLFQSDVATCTITNLAEVMSVVKDESSWDLMIQYLPYIANMPMTVTPPDLPSKLIKFDEERGIKEILRVVKPLLTQQENTDDPFAQLSGFAQFVYYYPLKKINRNKLKKMANLMHYSDADFKLLEDKMN